jgi:GT2 family glycosyltransferase
MSLASGGDVDLAWRVGDLGLKLAIATDAFVFHACRPTVSAIFRQFFRYGTGHAQLFKKRRPLTGKWVCVNGYPFVGCAKGILRIIAIAGRRGSWEIKREQRLPNPRDAGFRVFVNHRRLASMRIA